MNFKSFIPFIVIFAGYVIPLRGQDLDSLINLGAFTEESEFQKILNKKAKTGSLTEMSSREMPGIMSVVTRDEIVLSGARDLVDVLRLVPGFDVSQDLQFVLGLSLRGAWANEGKILFMVDGQPYNDLLYQTTPVGNHFPVENIERIEIIRGPGSAIYGGSAEYGVINIITRAAESLDGVHVYGVGGLHKNAIGRQNAGFSVARKSNIDWDLSFFTGKSIVSDQLYQDLYYEDEPQDLSETSFAKPFNISGGIKKDGFHARVYFDRYKTADPFDFASFQQALGNLSYKININDKFSVTPRFNYINQIPWAYGEVESESVDFKIKTERYHGEIASHYAFSRKLNLDGGLVYYHDRAADLLNQGSFGDNNAFSMNNAALYLQGLYKARLFNITGGFRYEYSPTFGSAVAPRMALTKKIENLHFKALYSHSFRTPSIQNINLALYEAIDPEKSRVYELEIGYQLTPEMLFTINGFHNSTRDIITYYYESSNDEEWYENSDKSGTKGIEMNYGYRSSFGFLNVAYSYSEALPGNTTEKYQTHGHNRQFIGQLRHKMTANALLKVSRQLSVNSSVICGGRRFAFTDIDEGENPVAGTLDPYLLLNAYVQYSNLVNGLDLGLGVFDILNEKPSFAQPFNGDYAPVPGRSSEWIVKVAYNLNFKK